MKARVKATGEFVDVEIILGVMKGNFHTNDGRHYEGCELDFSCEPDYWGKLKHQAAISAMQSMIRRGVVGNFKDYAEGANDYATALVEKLKFESNGN